MYDNEIIHGLDELDQEWNGTKAAKDGDFTPVPPGEYEVVITDADMYKSSTGTIGKVQSSGTRLSTVEVSPLRERRLNGS